MRKTTAALITGILFSVGCVQSISITAKDLVAKNVTIESSVHKGSTATRIAGTDLQSSEMAILRDQIFDNGSIEVDLSGQPLPGTDSTYRGFIGIAFRLQETDTLRYECFYLRPTNARAEDQLRRNHSVQYISAPYHPWQKLRSETPGLYESYVDMAAGEWTHVKIEVQDRKGRLYVNHAEQPCLIVNEFKGTTSNGSIALWIGPGTDGYFKNLKITHN